MRYEVTGKNKNSLRSHALAFLSHHPAAMAIPRHLCTSEYYVVFAKLTDSKIDCESKTRLLVRKLTTYKLRILYAEGIDQQSFNSVMFRMWLRNVLQAFENSLHTD